MLTSITMQVDQRNTPLTTWTRKTPN